MELKNYISKNLIVGNIDNTIFEIGKIMRDFNIGFLPIAKGNKIVGVITDRDIVINCIANNELKSNAVKDYITKNIISIDISKSVESALNLMGGNKIKRLLVTNNNKLIGIISMADIINNYNNKELIIKNLKNIFEIIVDNYFKPKVNDFYL